MALNTIHTALMKGEFTLTTDTSIDPTKTYYKFVAGIYEEVETPVATELSEYYELGTMTKLICIKSYSGFNDSVESAETTTLCDESHTYIDTLKANENKTFSCNYDKDQYKSIKALQDDVCKWSLWFGENGEDGKFSFQGKVQVALTDGEVGGIREMELTIVPRTSFELEED